MIAIIEGIDRVGKTTLANKLHDEYGFEIYKSERQETSSMNYGSIRGLIDFLKWYKPSRNIVIDRFHWTEAVYGLVERNDSFTYDHIDEIESMMTEDFVLLYVRPTDIKWSSAQHGSDLSKHLKLFDALYEKTTMNKYVFTHLDLDKVKEVMQ